MLWLRPCAAALTGAVPGQAGRLDELGALTAAAQRQTETGEASLLPQLIAEAGSLELVFDRCPSAPAPQSGSGECQP
jgi:hypothetical protein